MLINIYNLVNTINFITEWSNSYLFFFSVCYCSKNYISRLMKQFDQECTKKCSGDNASSCGGVPNLVSFYITDSSSKLNFSTL